MDDIVANDFEMRVGQQVSDVTLVSSEEVVQADHFGAAFDQSIAQMASQEPGASGDQNSLT